MGILGLQTFMKLNDCCERVRLSDVADTYRNKTGKDPVLLIDCSSCIPHFYTSSAGIRMVLGELKKFVEQFKTFVNNCEELGIKLKMFGEGKRPCHKYRIWMKNCVEEIKNLMGIYSRETNAYSDLLCRGELHWVVSNYLLLKDTCKFSRAVFEADNDIFKYMKTEDCFAVLTNDSDFIVMEGDHYCLTPHKSNVQSMTFFNFNRSNLAKLLKINISQFPFFASLCLSHFQCSDLFELYKRKNINIQERFFGVAELIKNFTSKEELIQYIFSIMKPMEMTGLERRLNFYLGEELEDLRHTAQNHWGEILDFAERRHTTGEAHPRILTIIQDKVNFIRPRCENIFKSSCEYALLAIRKKIYGILFFEHPNSLIFVTEFTYDVNSSYHSKEGLIPKIYVRTVIVDRRSHPGLLKLWSLENSDSLKTSVFCETINNKLTAKDFSSLNIPVEYVFPIFAAFYFLWECDNDFKEFEVETILIQAVLANRLTYEQTDQLPEEFHLGALNLTGWFLSVLEYLWVLNSICGEPFSRYKTNLLNFFDGKVMHYVYGKMEKGESPWTSFSEYKKEYNTLYSVLYELGRICGHFEPREKPDSILKGDTAY